MLRSMYSGISGMKNFQTKLDVIGNNIANVNTSGFKKGRVTFQEMLAQTQSPAQGPVGDARGGINAAQVGLGSQLGTIDNIHTEGFRQNTNNPLDLSIQGDGYFIVQDGAQEFYTRSGNFYLDNNGYIVNSEGMFVLSAEQGRIQIPINDAQSFNILQDGTVQYIDNQGNRQPAGIIGLSIFSNPSGLVKEGNNLYRASDNSGEPNRFSPMTGGASGSQIISNSLEMSNVDLAEEFTEMITAQRGFQANTRIITTSDEILQELVNLKR